MKTGNDKEVQDYVMSFPTAVGFMKKLNDMMEYLELSQDDEKAIELDIQPGVGLAAPQLGILKKMFVVLTADEKGNLHKYALVNPQLVSHSVAKSYLSGGEGCLSVDREVKGLIHRPKKIRVQGYVYDFEKNEAVLKTIVLKGYLAVVFGHEFDHLNGILFVDRVNKENPFFVPENSKPIKFKD